MDRIHSYKCVADEVLKIISHIDTLTFDYILQYLKAYIKFYHFAAYFILYLILMIRKAQLQDFTILSLLFIM